MANLTTKQTIKVKVNQLDGSLVPQSKQPVVLKNTVNQTPSLGALGNVNESSSPAQGGTLVYNPTTQLYDVRKLTISDLGGISNSPSNNDILFYNAASNSFYYGSVVTTVAELQDVDTTGRANGMALVYNSTTNTYIHTTLLTPNQTSQVASLVIGTTGGVEITSISTFANTTQLGSNASGSATELVTARAVKDYVDAVLTSGGGGGGGAGNLNGLLDVEIGGESGLIRNQFLVYDDLQGGWINKTVAGNTNITITSHPTDGSLILSFANDVVIANTLTAVTVNANTINVNTFVANTIETFNAAVIGNNATVLGSLHIGQQLSVARAATFSNNVVINGTLTTTRDAAFSSNVSVNGYSTFSNTLTIQANAVVGQQLNVNGVINAHGGIVTSGPVTIGNTSTTLVIDAKLDSDIIPASNNTISLGSSTKRFKDIWVSGGTLYLGDVVVSAAQGQFSIDTAMTATGNAEFQANVVANDSLYVQRTTTLNGNVALGASRSDYVFVNGSLDGSLIPSANDTYSIGNTSMRYSGVYAHNVVSVTGNFSGDVTVSGNLYVQGSQTEINVETMAVEDPLIKLSSNNTSDIVDIGFYGTYNNGTERYTGLARDATSGNYVLFANLVAQPTTTVLVTSPSFTLATLNSYISGGGLTTNSTSITLTANSTTAVSIVANTLSLTTGLGSQYGGTGRQSLTNNAVIVGNGVNSVKQISGTNGQMLCIVGGVPAFVSSVDAGEY